MATAATLLPLLATLFFLLLPTTSSSPPTFFGLDSFMASQSLLDPQASNDSFLSLPSSIKKSLSISSFSHLSHLFSYLSSLQITIPLHVKLVGFSGHNQDQQLSTLVSALQISDHFQVIGADPHHLLVKHKLHLDVSSPPALANRIFDRVKSHLDTSPSGMRSLLHSVPFSSVDDIIQQDFSKDQTSANPGFTIYLLNLNPQSKPYAYAYTPGDSSPAFSKCLGTIWTGRERYLWVDLAAGPVDYGPSISGEGVLPRGEFHPLATLHGEPKSQKSFLADLASLIFSAYQNLLVPSLRIPVFFENSLVVEFVHVHGSDEKDSRGLDWDSIERTFLDEVNDGGLLLEHQHLRFKRYTVKFSDCPICSFAVSGSINSYTSRFLFENYTLLVSEYLDSKHLHHLLSQSGEELRKSAGIVDEDIAKTLPVYVFDLDYDKLLFLDRYHQAVAFKDMVIAVRTRSSQSVSDYSCNGRHVMTHTRQLEKPIVGSILQSMWGISPTHLRWSPLHNSTLVDYTWSVGKTPFGPFSETTSLSFVQRDAARRNVLLTNLNFTITSILDVLNSIAGHGGEANLLKKNTHVEFVQRWNMLRYKLDRTISAISHLDFKTALYFSRSSDHDLFAIHSLVYQASQELVASLVCFKDPPFPWASVIMVVAVFVGCFQVYLKRNRLFRNKRKQF